MEDFDLGQQRLQGEEVKKTLDFQDTEKVYTTTVDKFKPMQDYVVILLPKIEKKTKSGINKSERQVNEELAALPQVFEVVSVGPDLLTRASDTAINLKANNSGIQVGQYVLCKRVESVPVQSIKEGFEVAVVRMFDVIGVFDSI